MRPTDEQAQLGRLTKATMDELAKDFAFFNHGLLATRFSRDFDPLLDYLNACPDRPWIVPIEYNQPIFSGIGADADGCDFDRHLFAVPRPRIAELVQYFLGITAFDPNRNLVARVCSRIIRVVDPVALARHAILPAKIPTGIVHVFELASSRGGLCFAHDVSGPTSTARVVPTPPDDVAIGLLGTLMAERDPARQLREDSYHARIRTIAGIDPAPGR